MSFFEGQVSCFEISIPRVAAHLLMHVQCSGLRNLPEVVFQAPPPLLQGLVMEAEMILGVIISQDPDSSPGKKAPCVFYDRGHKPEKSQFF